jgi:type IV pilus assembly protein PilY1
MLGFGTGQKTPITNVTPTTYLSGSQALYGVWDWNMSAWNAKSSATYASLPATNADTGLTAPAFTATAANLTQQALTIDATTKDRDIATNAAVCFKGDTGCATGTFGWFLNLPGNTSQGSEQIVFNPQLLGSAFVVNSTVPADNIPTSCTVNTDTGFTYAVSMMNGAALNNFFPQYHDAAFPAGSTVGGIAGIETDATGTSFPVTTATGATWLVYQTVLNAHQTTQVNLPTNTKAKRLTWIELR